MFIQELLDDGSKITIITRPSRFGKTLNMMMLKYWFEKYSINQLANSQSNEPKTEHAYLFHNLKIWGMGEEYKKHCGRYPVVFLTFKDLKSSNWEKCYDKIRNVIREEFVRHAYLLDSKKLDEIDKQFINNILQNSKKEADFELSLLKLIKFLSKHYNEKVVVLIDEYDTPIHESYLNGYYDKVLDFLRSFLGAGLKDNTNLQYAIITGILRVSRESIFSDLNNTSIFTILEKTYSDKFGILENEVIKMFQDFGIMDDLKDVRSCYNVYMIGDTPNLYNPWSIVNYVQYHNDGLKPYWVNTSSNQMIKDLMTEGGSDLKQDIESLIQNKPIEKRIDPFIVFKDLDRNTDVVWTLFLFSGYLKVNGYSIIESYKVHYSLSIPNYEVKSIIERFLEQWLTDFISNHELEMVTKSLLTLICFSVDQFFS